MKPIEFKENMKHIFAGTYSQYKDYLKMKGLSPVDNKYVTGIWSIIGLEELEIVYVGTCKSRKDYYEITRKIEEIKLSGKIVKELFE